LRRIALCVRLLLELLLLKLLLLLLLLLLLKLLLMELLLKLLLLLLLLHLQPLIVGVSTVVAEKLRLICGLVAEGEV
jgi:hypothetical protein